MQYYAVAIRRLSAEAGAGELIISQLPYAYSRYTYTGLEDITLEHGGSGSRNLVLYGTAINVTLSASGRFSFGLLFDFTCEC